MSAKTATKAQERQTGTAPPHVEREVYRHVPYDIEIEQALLGAILVDNRQLEAVTQILKAEHFYDPLHQRLYETMAALQERGGMVLTPLTLHAAMKADPGLQEVGGHAYLVGLVQAAPAMPNVRDYARILHDLATRRALIIVGEDIVNAAYDAPRDCSIGQQIDAALGAVTRIETLVPADVATVRASTFADQPIPELEETVEGLIPKNAVTTLGGEGGAGKSLLALMLASSVQLGTNWLGKIVYARGPVLYLSAEDDLRIVHRRLAAIAEHEGVALDRFHHLHIVPLVGEDAVMGAPAQDGVIAPTALFRRVEGLVREIKPVLVIGDSQADLFGGDEVKRTQARQFVSLLRRLCVKGDTTFLLLTHPSLDGIKTGNGTSGSTAWSNSVRSRLYLTSAPDAEDDPDARVLSCKKANYGPKGGEIRMRWHRGVFTTKADSNSPDTMAAQARADRVFLDMLKAYNIEGRNVSASTGHGFAPAIFATDKRAAGIGKKALTDAMNRLLAAQRIRVEIIGPKSRQTRHLITSDGAAE